MVARVETVAFLGIEVKPIDVQVHITNGMPAFTMVGLPDKAVGESRERVRAALSAMGLALPPKRVTINLSPADVTKEGGHYDLPVALGLLAALGAVPQDALDRFVALGELALDGAIASVAGVLPAAIGAGARGRGIICPPDQGSEALWAGNIEVLAPPNLLALVNHFSGAQCLGPPCRGERPPGPVYPDMKEVKGQASAKRALEIAAAGGHNMLLIGPPGSGKSMLAARLPGLLPPLAPDEMLEVSMIHSVAGCIGPAGLHRARPFRDPHQSASLPALVGGGLKVRPGEASLAHRGVLFLDELPEFQRATLEALRQPMETGRISVARANMHVTYPARFQLVAAMNPCRCGFLGDDSRACSRAPACGRDYQARISGPLFDRIDLHVDAPPVNPLDLADAPPGETTAKIAARVSAARAVQERRFADQDGVRLNAEADGDLLEEIARPDADGRSLLVDAARMLGLSGRGYHRILRVARTLADLDGSDGVRRIHIAEAISFRRMATGG
ncbi:MAG: YifB family Mg chelatase-like AAA ATPase [Rhodospirillales bacterium]